MFACQACTRRYLRTLTSIHADIVLPTLTATSRYLPRPSPRRQARRNVFTPASESATYTPDQQPNVPPMSWRKRNEGLDGADVVSWRDAPSLGQVRQKREDEETERNERKESHAKRLEEHETARESREAKEVWNNERERAGLGANGRWQNEPRGNGARHVDEIKERWRQSSFQRAADTRRDVSMGKPDLRYKRSVNALRRDRQATRRLESGDSAQEDLSAAEPTRENSSRAPLRSKRLTEQNLNTELKYLQDPLKLADHVRYTLDQDDGDKGLALVRLSSKKLANTVSWNHVIDWQMKQGKTKVALETYNEMKKRGQKPDSYTYLLLLRGLADHAHHPHTLGRALSLYHAINAEKSSERSTVIRNIIHTNAILKVCSRADDLDSMWDIASQLPDRGPHAANNWTYTTIFNCMRNQAININAQESAEDVARGREATIVDARKLWTPVIQRWRQGDLLVDEVLVCAMGRLLLIGSRPRDWDDVLSLVRQTMNIPRLLPRLGSAAREASGAERIRAPAIPADMKNDAGEIVDEYGDARPGDEFNAVDDIVIPKTVGASALARGRTPSHTFIYARPGHSTLSLILEACLKMAAKQPARNYWDLLTDPSGYAVRPDFDNVSNYLRILRQARAAAEAVALVCDEMPRLHLVPSGKIYRIAMSACQRDSKNPNILEHVGRLLKEMPRTCTTVDITTLSIGMELVRDLQNMTALLTALEQIDPLVINLRSLLTFGHTGMLQQKDRDTGVDVIKGFIGALDRVLRMHGEDVARGGEGVGKVKKHWCEARRSSAASFVTRWNERQMKRREKEDVAKEKEGPRVVSEEELMADAKAKTQPDTVPVRGSARSERLPGRSMSNARVEPERRIAPSRSNARSERLPSGLPVGEGAGVGSEAEHEGADAQELVTENEPPRREHGTTENKVGRFSRVSMKRPDSFGCTNQDFRDKMHPRIYAMKKQRMITPAKE